MRTLRGRVALLAVALIAGWLALLTVAFNVYLGHRLRAQADTALRVRAQAASATLAIGPSGSVRVGESATDGDLDTDIWIYARGRALARPTAAGSAVQKVADSLAGADKGFTGVGDDARVYVLPVRSNGARIATVVVAQSTAGEHRAEGVALVGSIAVSALLLAVAYPVIRMGVRRALDPMDAMARQAADWSAHETGRRFGTGQRYVELRELAADLDGLLDRLSAVLRHERQLSGELSHELRTPLAHIAAEADLLVHSGKPSDRQAHVAIADTARAMDRIIETLLDAARAQPSTVAGTCELASVFDAVNADGTARLTGEAPLTVGVDGAVLERILAPVLANAHRYARTSVVVDAARTDSGVRIDVVNDGPALEPALAERVFEPGFRADPADGHAGAGLGLALARRLARSADGDVTAIATPTGSTFRISLPAG